MEVPDVAEGGEEGVVYGGGLGAVEVARPIEDIDSEISEAVVGVGEDD